MAAYVRGGPASRSARLGAGVDRRDTVVDVVHELRQHHVDARGRQHLRVLGELAAVGLVAHDRDVGLGAVVQHAEPGCGHAAGDVGLRVDGVPRADGEPAAGLGVVLPALPEAHRREARARGYLRFGLCAGRLAPLIKTVVATSGQAIEIADDVRVDGRPLLHSRIARVDGQGREMVPYDGGIVPPGAVFLHSEFPGSFDSRYFGPSPMDGILGLAREVPRQGA